LAHLSEVVGIYSQLIAKAALLANGWIVGEPETAEPFDFWARDPITGQTRTFQCKTIFRRPDRNNDYVMRSKNGRGNPYSKSDVDFIIGVTGDEMEPLRVFYAENEERTEMWAAASKIDKKWTELPIRLNRDIFENKGKGEIA